VRQAGFVLAAIEMMCGAPWRRHDWRGSVFVSLTDRKYWYSWPSGVTHLWHPTPEDLAARDWESVY